MSRDQFIATFVASLIASNCTADCPIRPEAKKLAAHANAAWEKYLEVLAELENQ